MCFIPLSIYAIPVSSSLRAVVSALPYSANTTATGLGKKRCLYSKSIHTHPIDAVQLLERYMEGNFSHSHIVCSQEDWLLIEV